MKPKSRMNKQRGFTLVEMLAVLVIMGLLIIFAVPAVEHVMKSSGLSAATREVSNTLGLARQYAITHRTNTRVIFAYNNGVPQTSSNQDYIAYTVVVADPAATPAPGNNVGWDYIGKWEFLPNGVIFLNDTPGNTPFAVPPSPTGPFLGGYNLNTTLQNNFLLYFPATNSVNLVAFAYIEFGPTGADTRSDGNTDQITLTEGFIQPPSANLYPFRTSSNFVNIAVDSIVGRIQIQRP
jgi:prepilin-type N-terminal cleavage/methylation domain-containing protein